MKKLICALIGAAALVASATTYIQTSSTGTAPWKPVKDSVSQAHLADSARHAPPSAYADSSRVSGLADSAKRAGWAPLDSGRVRGIVGDTATTLRSNMAGYLPLIGGTLTGFLTGTSAELWTNINAHDYGPALTLHGSIYTSDANLLLRSSSGYGNCVGFSDQSKSVGFQRWNLGVENDTFQIQANSVSDGPGGESALKLDRNGNLTILGTLTAFSFTGNTSTATKLQTARTIATSGDVTGTPTAFDGTANITIPTALPTLLTAGSAGSATTVPTLTWDAKGRLTGAGSAAISIPHAQINDWSTATSSFLTANQSISLTGAVTGSGTTSIATTFANTHLAGINQDLATTSSPTFASVSVGRGSVTNYTASPSYGAIYGSGVTPNGQNCAIAWSIDGTNVEINGTIRSALDVNNVDILVATASGVSVSGALTVSGLITANGGITANGISASNLTVNNAIHTDSLWVCGDALTFHSPNATTASLGVTAHPMYITMADGSLALPSGLSVNGSLDLHNVTGSNLTYSAASHKGCLIRLQPSDTFTLPASAVIGDWCIVCGGAPSQQGATAGRVLAPGGMFVRGSETPQTTLQLYGAVIAAYDGYAWYVG